MPQLKLNKACYRTLAATLAGVSIAVFTVASPAQQAVPASVAAPSSSTAIDRLLPAMREWRPGNGILAPNQGRTIAIAPNASAQIRREADRLAADLSIVTQSRWAVAQHTPRAGDIGLVLGSRDTKLGEEGYRLTIDDRATITAATPAGLYYGGRTLLQLARLAPDPRKPVFQRGVGLDYPEVRARTVMLDLGRHYFHVENIKALIATMGERKLNMLHLHFTDWPAFRLDSPRYPGLAPKGASYNRDDIRAIEAAAAANHVTIIPEIDLPAHAVPLTDYRPELGFKCESMRTSPWLRKAAPELTDKAWTVDVTKAENRAWLKGLLGEFIPWFDGPYFHVGGDEYQYDVDKNKCPELVAAASAMGLKYPGDVMIRWLNEANATVKSFGKRTVAWSWWGFRDDKFSIHPDRDIVIEVWNPEMQAGIMAQGNDVLLSPEDTTYVTPAEDLKRKGDTYGVVDLEKVYGQFPLDRSPQVLGYSLSIWADGAERHTDNYFIGRADEPMIVMAERLWSGQPRGDLWSLLKRANDLDATRPSAR